uniref:Uncharacterized protein n=1 Tax=Glossina brevipalpis TaxID=37001 RepID=A0A1A9WQJ7_9MUSC
MNIKCIQIFTTTSSSTRRLMENYELFFGENKKISIWDSYEECMKSEHSFYLPSSWRLYHLLMIASFIVLIYNFNSNVITITQTQSQDVTYVAELVVSIAPMPLTNIKHSSKDYSFGSLPSKNNDMIRPMFSFSLWLPYELVILRTTTTDPSSGTILNT